MNYEPINFKLPPLTDARWNGIPEHMRDGLRDYLQHGCMPGHFLQAILEGNLFRACDRADMQNRRALYEYVYFLHNYAPRVSYGSPGIVEEWIRRGGLDGRR